ncbi:hypothetical protein G647_09748 [Cladophialophora carrionii CBS 160.54]|uniref:Beta-lactamase-related domain-containing protein n=1 Tax=Cladophialophora carrionii CBS 160.54 TaxID=1279043 RepID=V9DK52_9EURO|nr:uncharacterized protein G647_09748 [Cladophialophora carrionii CBS 160.54]ETI27066.1 hypothetical protein G647_09748 [Cladophialophora carrionii CBS 160.54]
MAWEEEFESATKPGPGRRIVGAVVIAADASGNIVHHDAKGFTSVDPETAKPMSEDTTFWIASCTKLLTTICALQNVEQGKLVLDDDVSEILPEWKSPDILTGWDHGQPQFRKATKKITLRQLLTHSSGMGYDFLSPELAKWREWRGEAVRPGGGEITKQYFAPLLYEPGENWAYSVSIDWAGKMVERVNGGISLGEYMQQNIFDPLGMTSTGFRPERNENISRNLCPTTKRTPEGDLVPTEPYAIQNPKDDLGGGGLYSAAPDYVRVLISLLRNDGKLLRSETVKSMFTPQLSDDSHLRATVGEPLAGPMFRGAVDSPAWNFGLGGILNMEDVDGVCKKGTLTWGGLPNLFWWIDPAAGNCGIYASQIIPPGDAESMALAVAYRRDIFAKSIAQS